MFTYREYHPRIYLNLLEMQPNVANTGIYSHPHRSGSFRRSHLKCWTSQKDAHIRLDLSFGDGILFSLGNEKKMHI